ncbi:phenylalanine-4-hydroxylase [Chitinivorax tropicus]|uniref:Phenylalanine-4-hydroxylase n=1 Tax=Chitinivorax tropicus TaxID=714531 RepID=A0A840MHB4_9PROT|nr:phenylalanine 4-monooxygenase [Chitinivorax tropicus]MBB5016915.1 phenylalanine-4-hydroxylase [Chitinivorax tropicus]
MLKPDNPLRGNYSHIRADYTVEQDWQVYTAEEHDLYRRLFERQSSKLKGYAAEEFIENVHRLASDGLPCFDDANQILAETGWKIVAVPGLIPDDTFFTHLAHRQFPVTVWLRKPEEFDYIVEPDIFHDFFGHVPLLLNPVFADHLQAYGKGGLRAMKLDAVPYLARLYWYMVEFGLILTPEGLRTYGAGILSSGGEIIHCIDSPAPNRIKFDLRRVMQSEYRIDRYQDTYFVIDSFQQLFDETAVDFGPIYEDLKKLEPIDPSVVLPSDTLVSHTNPVDQKAA